MAKYLLHFDWRMDLSIDSDAASCVRCVCHSKVGLDGVMTDVKDDFRLDGPNRHDLNSGIRFARASKENTSQTLGSCPTESFSEVLLFTIRATIINVKVPTAPYQP